MAARVNQLEIFWRRVRGRARVAKFDLHADDVTGEIHVGDPERETLHVGAWAGCAVLWRKGLVSGCLQRRMQRLIRGHAYDSRHDQPDGDTADGEETADHGRRNPNTPKAARTRP